MLAEDSIAIQNSRRRGKHKPNVCHFFSTKTGCKFGDKCKFKHEVLSVNRPGTSEEIPASLDRQPSNVDQHEEVSHLASPVDTSSKAADKEQLDSEVQLDCTAEDEDSHEDRFVTPDTTIEQICHHFVKRGWCRFGKRCRLVHPKRERTRAPSQKQGGNSQRKVTELTTSKLNHPEDNETARDETTKQVSKPGRKKQLCRFYLNGHCSYGSRCKFAHDASDPIPVEADASRAGTQSQGLSQQATKQNSSSTTPAQLAKRRSDLKTEDVLNLRKTECDQLKKRFPKGKLEVLSESEDVSCYMIEIVPTDPDWPFDIKTFGLKVEFPSQYPLQMFSVEPKEDNVLPSAVSHYIKKRTAEWLEEKQMRLLEADVVELVFRPFLRWFDRSLEDIVTEGLRRYQRELAAKAAGFEFIPAKPVAERQQLEEEEEEEEESDDNRSCESEEDTDDDRGVAHSDSESDQENSEMKPNYADVERKGTEVLLRNLQLKENASTLLLQKLSIVIQCGRCKNTTEFTTPGGRLNSVPCPKCYSDQRLVFRPVLAHHFSAVVGYLDLSGCQPFDLVLQDCAGTVGCLNCSREMKFEGLVPGQAKQSWCQRCHKKLMVATESVRFQQLQPSELTVDSAAHQIEVRRPRRVGRDPAIQEGRPLPADGTCKHYKKSFRWLRFPCCGKCYPCDICHDDKEGDHEMKFASRMICGFCCKEQPYTVEKPCVLCGSQLTKTRSAHWEGGRGCRDKIKMSRNDIHKFSNMNKTVSKKAQDKQESKKTGKKTTKLRHT